MDGPSNSIPPLMFRFAKFPKPLNEKSFFLGFNLSSASVPVFRTSGIIACMHFSNTFPNSVYICFISVYKFNSPSYNLLINPNLST